MLSRIVRGTVLRQANRTTVGRRLASTAATTPAKSWPLVLAATSGAFGYWYANQGVQPMRATIREKVDPKTIKLAFERLQKAFPGTRHDLL